MRILWVVALSLLGFAVAWGEEPNGALRVKVVLSGRLEHATVALLSSDGKRIVSEQVGSGAEILLRAPAVQVQLVVEADGYDAYSEKVTPANPPTSMTVTMAVQTRALVFGPAGTGVALDGRPLGTLEAGRPFAISLVPGSSYVLKVGDRNIPFVARRGTGRVLYGVEALRKDRGISIGSKDYRIYPPPK